MRRLLVVTFAVVLLVGVMAAPAQAAEPVTPFVPDTTMFCVAAQGPYNDFSLFEIGDLQSGDGHDIKNCRVCTVVKECPPQKNVY